MTSELQAKSGKIDPTSEVVKTAPESVLSTPTRSLTTSRSLTEQEQQNG